MKQNGNTSKSKFAKTQEKRGFPRFLGIC